MNTDIRMNTSLQNPQKEGSQVPFVVQRGKTIIGSLVTGGISGLIVYGITCVIKFNYPRNFPAVINPLPYVLGGVINQGVVETARLAYDVALYILGDRNKYANLENSEKASRVDRFRQHTWKVINQLEKVQENIDLIYSRLFNIRTEKEIREKCKTAKEYYLSDPRFMEIVRRAFLHQTKETVQSIVPSQLTFFTLKKIGLTILGVEVILGGIEALGFLVGLIHKIAQVWEKVEVLKEKEQVRKKQEKEIERYHDNLKSLKEEFNEKKQSIAQNLNKKCLTNAEVKELRELSIEIKEETKNLTTILKEIMQPMRGNLVKKGSEWENSVVSFFGMFEKKEDEISLLEKDVQEIDQELKNIKKQKFDFDINLLKTLGFSDQLLEFKGVSDLIEMSLLEKEENQEKLKSQLNLFVQDIQENEKLGLSFDQAGNYTQLKQEFYKEVKSLNSKESVKKVEEELKGALEGELKDFFAIDAEKRPALLDQFVKDIPRQVSFKRQDDVLKIHDKDAVPSPHSTKKISKAAFAIAELIRTQEDQDWIPVLQLAVTQTTLNAACGFPIALLTSLGTEVRWLEKKNKDYALQPEFLKGELPLIQLQVIRNEKTQAIEKVNVKVEATADLIKKRVNGKATKQQIIAEEALKMVLTYTITMHEGQPSVGNVERQTQFNVPGIIDTN